MDTQERLHALSASGDIDAQIKLGTICENDGKINMSRGWFAHAAKLGSVPALRHLGISLVSRSPKNPADGVKMIREASASGDAKATYLCGVMAALDEKLEHRWKVAYGFAEHAAHLGMQLAQKELALLKNPNSLETLSARPFVNYRFRSPRIGIVENFVSHEICDWLIERARPFLSRASVYDPTHDRIRYDQARDNSEMQFGFEQTDLILIALRAAIASLAGKTVDPETTAILNYQPGQRFEPHCDFLDPTAPRFARELATQGQRIVTFLLYLNDDYEGGETEFLEMGWSYKGRKGDALIFWNIDNEGAPDFSTQHAGTPTTQGEKWLLSQWLRQRGP